MNVAHLVAPTCRLLRSRGKNSGDTAQVIEKAVLVMTVNSLTISVFRDFVTHAKGSKSDSPGTNIVWMLAFLPALLLVGFAAFQPWVDAAELFRDPLAVAELKGLDCCKVYDGAMSSLGVILWMAGASVCVFTAGVLVAANRSELPLALFFLSGGLFTAFLGFDDLFLVHENVLPAFGVSQLVTYCAYALIALSYLAMSWRIILQNRFVLLGCGIGFLAVSVIIDWFLHSENIWRLITEDGAKFIGISLWTAFHVEAAWHAILRTRA